MKSRKTWIMLLTLVFVLSLFLSACSSGGSEKSSGNDTNSGQSKDSGKDSGTDNDQSKDNGKPQDGGNIVVGMTGEPTNFNGYFYNDTASDDISDMMFKGLMTSNNKDITPEPVLADGQPEMSNDGLTYTFKLKKGVKFHDGQEMTADDVVFSYKIPLNKDYKGPRASSFDKIKSVKALDKYTVQFKLKQPYAPFLSETASYPVLPEHILKDVPVKGMEKNTSFNIKKPIGTGPYQFVEWKKGQYVKLKAFDDYFKGRPHLDTVTVKIVPDADSLMAQFQAGEIDYIDVDDSNLDTAQTLEQQGKAKLHKVLGMNYDYIGYNELNPLFKSKKIRQALAHAIDRKKILEGAVNGNGKLANTPGSPIQKWSYNPDVPTFNYDPKKAKKMLAEEGWKDHDGDGIIDKDGKKFEFELLTNEGNKRRETITQIVQQQLKEVGIKVHPKLMEFSAFLKKTNPPNWDYDAYVLGWSLGSDPDPEEIFSAKEIKQGLNNVHYKPDAKTENLMQENSKEPDQAKRGEMIKKLQATIAEDQPYTFLYYKNNVIIYNPKFHNVQQGYFGGWHKIEQWWVEQ